ncbi:MAG: hypothetical protein KC776_36060 [Myxococcales bacterium]|nr:hypothetical protein [Myxococcales bacterium]MCB9577879.1 hypothetical protein [Polyangiaceae bacterium]
MKGFLPTLALASAVLSGCVDPGAGVEPPLNRIYFPVGLAISPGATRLYVANSDFDLQFNAGSLQAMDLQRIRELLPKYCTGDSECDTSERCDLTASDANGGIPSHWCVAREGERAGKPCGALSEKSLASRVIAPGRCSYVDPQNPPGGGKSLVVGSVGIGAFATDVLYRARPTGPGGRLFIPVRGDSTLHYIDVKNDTDESGVPFELECGQGGNDGRCDDQHRRGDDPEEENTRGLRLAAEPFGIAATDDGEAIVLTHQTEGIASLFVNDAEAWGDGVTNFGVGPKLEFAVGGLPARPIGVAALPEPGIVKEKNLAYQPGFLVTFRDSAEVRLLRYYSDQASQPPRPFLQQAGAVAITANSLGYDSRGIAIDSSKRAACEAGCPLGGDARETCLNDCAAVPAGVYIANRTPATLLVGETRPNASATSSDDLPHFKTSVPISFGPSRVVVANVIDKNGTLAPRVFVVCFDSRSIFVFTPEGQYESKIETGRGPHAFAVDSGGEGTDIRALGFVGHFTDSYIGVIDLDQRHKSTYGTILMTLGRPVAPRASK